MFIYSTARDRTTAGYAMVADRFVVVVDRGAGAPLVERLWEAMTAPGAVIEDALTVIAGIGVGSLPDFALVELLDAHTSAVTIAVRGGATVSVDGPRGGTFDGGDSATWREISATHVTHISLAIAASDAGEHLPLGRGIVRADRLGWGAAPTTPMSAPDPLTDTLAVDRELWAELRSVIDAPPAEPVHVLRIGGDRVIALDLPVVLGRGPRPAQHPGARLETISSPQREVSSAHLEVRLDGVELIVRDLDSTNGTIVRAADGAAMLLRDGATVRISAGTTLDLGDGTVAVFEPSA